MTEQTASLRDCLVTQLQAREFEHKDIFRMSNTGRCIRYQLADRAGITRLRTNNYQGMIKMGMGSILHWWIQKHIIEGGFMSQESAEQEVYHGTLAVGHVDGIADNPAFGKAVIEIKTTDDSAITKWGPSENYFWQGFAYCMALDINKLYLFLVGRRQGITKELVYTLSDTWRDRINEHWKELETAWDAYKINKILPACSHRFKWEDKLCPPPLRHSGDYETSGQGHDILGISGVDAGAGDPSR